MWIKLHRKLLKWEWYSDINVTRLFIHLLLTANWKDGRFQGIEIPKGSLITGRKKLAKETGLSEQQIRTALTKLKSTNEITIKTTSKYSIISIQNYDVYQETDQQINQQATKYQPSSNHNHRYIDIQNNIDILKKEKINKKEKKFQKPTLEEIQNYISEKGLKVSAEGFIDYYEANGWKIGRNNMKDWKATLRNWDRREFNQPSKQIENKPEWYGKEIQEDIASEEDIKKLEAVLNANM